MDEEMCLGGSYANLDNYDWLHSLLGKVTKTGDFNEFMCLEFALSKMRDDFNSASKEERGIFEEILGTPKVLTLGRYLDKFEEVVSHINWNLEREGYGPDFNDASVGESLDSQKGELEGATGILSHLCTQACDVLFEYRSQESKKEIEYIRSFERFLIR